MIYGTYTSFIFLTREVVKSQKEPVRWAGNARLVRFFVGNIQR
ncbi:hypothetical protein Cal7507_5101 [Calothrix sp. PCC 7507]|nr:hypothetical protein Cal7507_5101 [Calothrix sp. PCC 7507]